MSLIEQICNIYVLHRLLNYQGQSEHCDNNAEYNCIIFVFHSEGNLWCHVNDYFCFNEIIMAEQKAKILAILEKCKYANKSAKQKIISLNFGHKNVNISW